MASARSRSERKLENQSSNLARHGITRPRHRTSPSDPPQDGFAVANWRTGRRRETILNARSRILLLANPLAREPSCSRTLSEFGVRSSELEEKSSKRFHRSRASNERGVSFRSIRCFANSNFQPLQSRRHGPASPKSQDS